MNKKKKILCHGLAVVMLLATVLGNVQCVTAQAEETEKVSVLFTHDLHSHFESFQTVYNGEDTNIGGFARIQTIINEQREKDPQTLLLDAGDFSMGTLYQTIFETEAPELRLMGEMGFEATTLGNHEFDYRTEGLYNMLDTAVASGEPLPSLLVCNIDWSELEEGAGAGASQEDLERLTEQQALKEAFENYGMKDYMMVEKNGVNIAIIGVFGEDAYEYSPTCALKFEKPIDAVKQTVREIEENEDADMLVCISHCGTSEDINESEDEQLAKAVPELDLIISGHSHTTLTEPIVYGDTSIVSAGEYGKAVGSLTMEENDNDRWKVVDYKLIPTTEDVSSDTAVAERIAEFKKSIDTDYLSRYGYKAEEVIAHNSHEFATTDDLSTVHTEHNLGNIMSDAYIYAVENAKDYDGHPVDVAVVPSGCVRDTYVKGDITVSDVYNSFSLGIGKDGISGYPLISVYLTGEELKIAAEIDASISDFMTVARLYMSGMNMTYNPNRLILNKVTDVYLTGSDTKGFTIDSEEKRREIEDDRLYRVVTDLYTGQMLNSVTAMSYGLLSVVPKNADGTAVEDFEDCIIYEEGQELKAWTAIASYLSSFEKNAAGVSEIPAYYVANQNRKVVEDDSSIGALISNPNRYAVMIVGILAVVVILLVLLVVFITKRIRRICKKRKQKLGKTVE